MPFSALYFHLIWSTKERLPLIQPAFEKRIYGAIRAKVEELDGRLLAIGGTENHIHVAVQLPPKHSVAEVVGQLKGVSSHLVNSVIKPGFDFYWQHEYGALSFGRKNLEVVVNYINNQKQHHADNTANDYLERVDDE
jgi:putative transposase